MSASLIELHRAGHQITLADKIESVGCIAELTGFYNQLRNDGRLTEETKSLIATRKAELQRTKK